MSNVIGKGTVMVDGEPVRNEESMFRLTHWIAAENTKRASWFKLQLVRLLGERKVVEEDGYRLTLHYYQDEAYVMKFKRIALS